MRKILLLLIAMITLAVNAENTKQDIPINIHPKTHPIDTEIIRSPTKSGVEAYYETESSTIVVSGNQELKGEVFLYDASGAVEDFSTEINSTLRVISTGLHTVVIVTDKWYGVGQIDIPVS